MSTFGAYRRNSRGAVAACLVTAMTASSASLTPTRASRTWPSACAWKVKVSCDGRSACGFAHAGGLAPENAMTCRGCARVTSERTCCSCQVLVPERGYLVSRRRECRPSARESARPAAGHSAVLRRRRSVPRRRSASTRRSPLRHSAGAGTLTWRRSTPQRRTAELRRPPTRPMGKSRIESLPTMVRLGADGPWGVIYLTPELGVLEPNRCHHAVDHRLSRLPRTRHREQVRIVHGRAEGHGDALEDPREVAADG